MINEMESSLKYLPEQIDSNMASKNDTRSWKNFFLDIIGPLPSIKNFAYLFILICVMLFITNVSNWYTLNYADELSHDILFDIFPDWSDIELPLPNFVTILQGACILFGVRPLLKTICQIAFLVSILDIIRALTIASTMLPMTDADKHSDKCLKQPKTFVETFIIVTKDGTCGDYMFSGHMVTSIFFLLFTLQRSRFLIFALLSIISSFLMWLLLVAMRWHYTDDIIIAALVATLSFVVYDTYSYTQMWFYF